MKYFFILLFFSPLFGSEKISLLYENYLKNPNDLNNIKNIATYYKENKNYNKAIDFYKICIEKEPDNPYNHYELALCYKLKGRPDIGLQTVSNALFYFENNERLNILYADLLLDIGKIKEALSIYEKWLQIIEKKDTKAYIYGKIGRCYFEQKKYEISESYFVDSLQLKQNSWNYYYLSRLYVEKKEIEKALWAIKKALAYSKNSTLEKENFERQKNYVLYLKAIKLKDEGDKEKAKTLFKEISYSDNKKCIYVEKANYWLKRL